MINKYNVTINDDKSEVEACKQSSAIGKAFHDYININKIQHTDKVVLEITSEKVGEAAKSGETKEEKVDLKKAQELVDKSRVVIQEGKTEEK